MPREVIYKTSLVQSNGDSLLAQWGLGIAAGSLLLILIVTLFPFDFHFSDKFSLSSAISRFYGWGDPIDWFNNIILFIPFGLGLTCLLQKTHLQAASKIAAVLIIIISAGLSSTVEILQLFLPSRFSAFSDIIANSAGGLVGFFCARIWKTKILALLLALTKSSQQRLFINQLKISLAGYFFLACLITFALMTTSYLNNWDEGFTLLIGNEHTGDRPWQGFISELAIADRAISSTEVEHAFSDADLWHNLNDSLIGHYQFCGYHGSYQDQTSRLPALSWRMPESQDSIHSRLSVESYPSHDRSGVFLDSGHWLESRNPATSMTHAIRSTSQFTLSVTIATANPLQIGPARIISLSGNPYTRNFTLGQDRSDLIFRLRTRFSGKNGASPELMIPNVFTDTNVHQIIIVYDSRYFHLYVDKAANAYSLEMLNIAIMNPVITLHSLLSSPLDHYFTLNINLTNLSAYKILYFALIFIPIGSMIGLITLIGQSPAGKISLSTVSWLILPVIILEGIFASVNIASMRLENILINLGISTAAMLLFRLWATTWLFSQPAIRRTHAKVAPVAG